MAAAMPGGFRLAVSSLPVAPSVRSKLEAAGFGTRGDLENIGPVDLAREAELTHEEALSVLREVGSRFVAQAAAMPAPTSALDVLHAEQRRRHIITFCAELDGLLGGGVAPGEITEICGGPGLGKTQLCVQLCINVQLPPEFGGMAGEAIYIDTEGSFMPERACDMAAAAGAHLRALAAAATAAAASSADGGATAAAATAAAAAFTPAAVLSRLHFFRAYDATTQAALCAALPELCAARPRVRLIVLDSVAFHYRQGHDDYAARARALAGTFAALMRLATSSGIAVVVTNQMTTKPGGGAEGGSRLAPALGESFAHHATQRLLLFWAPAGGGRAALLFKSPRRPRGQVAYAVTAEGVRSARRKRAAAEQPPQA